MDRAATVSLFASSSAGVAGTRAIPVPRVSDSRTAQSLDVDPEPEIDLEAV